MKIKFTKQLDMEFLEKYTTISEPELSPENVWTSADKSIRRITYNLNGIVNNAANEILDSLEGSFTTRYGSTYIGISGDTPIKITISAAGYFFPIDGRKQVQSGHRYFKIENTGEFYKEETPSWMEEHPLIKRCYEWLSNSLKPLPIYKEIIELKTIVEVEYKPNKPKEIIELLKTKGYRT